jgi:hypothetical protein
VLKREAEIRVVSCHGPEKRLEWAEITELARLRLGPSRASLGDKLDYAPLTRGRS